MILFKSSITGSFTAKAAAEKLEDTLKKYEVDINNHIVATANDGASVMTAMGDLLPTLQQLCHAHGIHLAVVEVMYKVR